jgi:hypothetical protein
MRILAIVFILSSAMTAVFGADDRPPGGGSGPKDELVWMQPPTVPPMAAKGPVRARIVGDMRARSASGEIAGLRALSLREGSAVVTLAGAQRPIRPGDRIGSARVKAIGSDRIILEEDGPGGTGDAATLVVTFGPGGVPRVRTYAPMTARTPPPEIR